MKTVEEFIKKLEKDPAKMDALKRLKSEEEAKKFIKKEGISCTAEELGNALKRYMGTNKELSDNELSNVTGGEIEWAEKGNKMDPSNVVFAFHVGDRVEVYISDCFWLYYYTQRGTIKKAYIYNRNNDNEDYYPVYDIQLDNGEYRTKVWQDSISY